MPSPKKDLSIEEKWLSEQDASQQTRFLKKFCPKSEVHNLEGISYPISNAKSIDILIRCKTNNKYLKRIQNKPSSEPIKRADDLFCYTPEGQFGPVFFERKAAVRLLNLAMIHELTGRSRRSQAKIREQTPRESEKLDSSSVKKEEDHNHGLLTQEDRDFSQM